MNILEQLQQAQRASEISIQTHYVLEMGEKLEFVSRQGLMVGNIVLIGLYHQPAYGKAKIVENPYKNDYYAVRVE